jgi:hypothetical protein
VKETDVPGVVLANAGVASPVTRPAVMSAAAIFVIRRPARLLIVARFTFPVAMLFIFVPFRRSCPLDRPEVMGRKWRADGPDGGEPVAGPVSPAQVPAGDRARRGDRK